MEEENIFKICRKNIGLKQYEVAEKLNIVRSTVSKWESGASIPDQTILPKVANLYGVTIDYLLNNDKNNTTHSIPVVARSKNNTVPKHTIELTDEQYNTLLEIIKQTKK